MKHILSALGCSTTQVQVYKSLASLGPSPASTIAKQVGLKRTTVYAALEALLEKSLIQATVINGLQHFQLSDPSLLQRLFDARLKREQGLHHQVQTEIQEIRQLQSHHQKNDRQVHETLHFYQGQEAVNNLLEENTTSSNTALRKGLKISGETVVIYSSHAENSWALQIHDEEFVEIFRKTSKAAQEKL